MRTTLSLDDDVAALLEKVRKAKDASLKEVVNAALRDAEALRLEMVETCEHPEEFVAECYTHRGDGHGGETRLDYKFCQICRKLEFWNNGQWIRNDQLARDKRLKGPR